MERRGLTFLEIMFTSIILASVVSVFIKQMVNFRYAAQRNRERVIALSLAREKIEELRSIPIRKLRDDWQTYRGESSATSHNIFRDEFFGMWAKMDEDKKLFWSKMSDIITKKGKSSLGSMPEPVFEKFKRNYRQQYGRTYEPYDEEYGIFRRFTRVDDLTKADNPNNILKRVTITIEINSHVHKAHQMSFSSYFSDN